MSPKNVPSKQHRKKPLKSDIRLESMLHTEVIATESVNFHEQSVVPYDEMLLDRTRTQWQFGDWRSLSRLDRKIIQHHPDRGKLALLSAAGRIQTGDKDAKLFFRLAHDWGVSKNLITQVLVACLHNSLGRAAALAGQQDRALQHFESSVAIAAPGSDIRLLTEARINHQYNDLGCTLCQLEDVPAISSENDS